MLRPRELKLLSCLRVDGRISLATASKQTKIPISTLFEKLKRYNTNIIRRTTILLNFEALGYGTRASIFLRTTKDHRKALEDCLNHDSHVNNLFKISNGWDYLAEGVFKDIQDLQDFLESIEEQCPVEKQIHFILGDLKKEAFLTELDLPLLTLGASEGLKT